ncbi:hypothetical protein IH992_10050 [Candidatus Poribacteria bacterium]|nr:hypothetical protein [Candidatus Poribacteria bacterium]
MARKKQNTEKVLKWVQESQITVSKGAQLLKMPIQDLMDLLNERAISLDGEPEEIAIGLDILRRTLRQVDEL